MLNEYRTQLSEEQRTAEYEKALIGYENVPQPRITDVKLDVALYPDQPKAVTRGSYVIQNRTGRPLDAVHVRWLRPLKMVSLEVEGAKLVKEHAEHDYRIYRFDRPMAPLERRRITFETLREQRGFRNSGNERRIVDNGTFLDNTEIAPFLGMGRDGLLQDRAKRRKYGLPPELRDPPLEDESARGFNGLRRDSDWVNSDITVSTSADQVAIAPGYLESDTVADGRRTLRYRSDAPIQNFFSIQSARYEVAKDRWKNVDLAIYHDPAHGYNVERMITAMKASLDYFTANFSPFQFRQVRILEFPAYADFAQSFANTIPYSEGIGFIADYRDPEKIDMVTYVTAHEIAHQWWGHQVTSALQQGGTFLVESLAQYSALMVMEQMYGPEQIRKFLKYELDRYLRARGGEVLEELPLMRVENQPYIHYQKGGAGAVPPEGPDRRGQGQRGAARPARGVRVQAGAVPEFARPAAALPCGGRPGARAADHRPVREDHAVRREGDGREVEATGRRALGRHARGRGPQAVRGRQGQGDRGAAGRAVRGRRVHRRAGPQGLRQEQRDRR